MHEGKNQELFHVLVSSLQWRTGNVFEVGFERPAGFTFIPGQKIQLVVKDISREYTLINSPDATELAICVRYVTGGRFTPLLSEARIGEYFLMSSAGGFFTYQSTTRPAIFVATGTGIAPFLAFVRAGIRDFLLLQGGRMEEDLVYRDEVAEAAREYIPFLSASEDQRVFRTGHVTNYLENSLAAAIYDFYLCGSSNMTHDAIRIIDRLFPDSRVYVETFF